MRYTVELTTKSQRFLKKLDKPQQKRIRDKLRKLRDNPKLGKPLTADLAGVWSLRIGKYRALYTIEKGKLVVLILRIEHRKKSY